MNKEFYGRWKGLPHIVVNVSAETRGKARYQIYKQAQEAYPQAKFTEIQVRRGQFSGYPYTWLERLQK